MYNKILFSNNLSIKDKLKNVMLYYSRKRGAAISWKKRHSNVFNLNKDYKKPFNKEYELAHIRKWSTINKNINSDTFRICANLSGYADPAIVPEEVFVADIEPTLNPVSHVNYISNKSFYNRWFKDGFFPNDFFHKIEGQYYDSDFNRLTREEFAQRVNEIEFPVVVKPNRDSYGGKGVRIITNVEEIINYCEQNQNVIIQELINQHDFLKKYHPGSINTLRVYLYKSVTDDEWKFLVAALRMGKDGSMDNATSGGIYTFIRNDGRLNDYAVDKYGAKYFSHPNTKYKFNDIIPNYDKLIDISIHIAQQIFLTRIVGLDFSFDINEEWRVIEVNTSGHSIRFAQYAGRPFFGQFTDEVIEYCRNHHWSLKPSI